MADHVAARVDRSRRKTFCAACGREERPSFDRRAPEGWLRVSALVVVNDGRDDWDLLGMCCSTTCLIVLAQKVDRQAREVADG
jgi:hypothetical protein